MNLRRLATLFVFATTIGCDANAPNTTTLAPTPHSPSKVEEVNEPGYEIAEIYTTLRDQVLQVDRDALGYAELGESTVVVVLLETAYPEGVATLVAVIDGTASLYFSNGGGIIGSGEHESVRKVCGEIIAMAQQYVPQSTSTTTFPLPKQDNVRCYLVTPGSVYTFEATEDDLGNERHPCSPLFHKGHELIAAIREHTPE